MSLRSLVSFFFWGGGGGGGGGVGHIFPAFIFYQEKYIKYIVGTTTTVSFEK